MPDPLSTRTPEARSPMWRRALDYSADFITGGSRQPYNFTLAPGARLKGVDQRLIDSMDDGVGRYLAANPGYSVQITPHGAMRDYVKGKTNNHPQGKALDIAIYDANGKYLPNQRNAKTFRDYEQVMQGARQYQLQNAPELTDKLRAGAYFQQGTPYDQMHLDISGGNTVLGNWKGGLNKGGLAGLPGAQSVGMGEDWNRANANFSPWGNTVGRRELFRQNDVDREQQVQNARVGGLPPTISSSQAALDASREAQTQTGRMGRPIQQTPASAIPDWQSLPSMSPLPGSTPYSPGQESYTPFVPTQAIPSFVPINVRQQFGPPAGPTGWTNAKSGGGVIGQLGPGPEDRATRQPTPLPRIGTTVNRPGPSPQRSAPTGAPTQSLGDILSGANTGRPAARAPFVDARQRAVEAAQRMASGGPATVLQTVRQSSSASPDVITKNRALTAPTVAGVTPRPVYTSGGALTPRPVPTTLISSAAKTFEQGPSIGHFTRPAPLMTGTAAHAGKAYDDDPTTRPSVVAAAPRPAYTPPPAPQVPTAKPPAPPAKPALGQTLFETLASGAKDLAKSAIKPAVSFYMASGPVERAAKIGEARGAPGFWDAINASRLGPTDIARASYMAAQLYGPQALAAPMAMQRAQQVNQAGGRSSAGGGGNARRTDAFGNAYGTASYGTGTRRF